MSRSFADEGSYMYPQFAPVCGVQMYEQMAIRNRLPSYHLLLAHDILARSDRYAAVFQNMMKGDRRTIILDNSVVELKNPIVDPWKIAEAAKIVGANVIVLPDIYEDAEETVKSCEDAYEDWPAIMDSVLGVDNWHFMMVPQGRNKQQFAWCAEKFADQEKYPKIRWWGIPRNQVAWVGSRRSAIETCCMLNPRRDIHMLGFSDDIMDDLFCARYSGFLIRGIDSAVPLRIAADGKPMQLSLTPVDVPPRPEGWLENGVYTQLVEDNIRTTQSFLVR